MSTPEASTTWAYVHPFHAAYNSTADERAAPGEHELLPIHLDAQAVAMAVSRALPQLNELREGAKVRRPSPISTLRASTISRVTRWCFARMIRRVARRLTFAGTGRRRDDDAIAVGGPWEAWQGAQSVTNAQKPSGTGAVAPVAGLATGPSSPLVGASAHVPAGAPAAQGLPGDSPIADS